MVWLRVSLWVQILLALYFQANLWFRLGSWNDAPGSRLWEGLHSGETVSSDLWLALIGALPLALFCAGYARRWYWLMWTCLAGYLVWAWTQFDNWWVPYLFGADERALNNQRLLQRTTKILPSFPDHPAPDGMHLVLDVLLLAAVVLTLLGLFRGPQELSALTPQDPTIHHRRDVMLEE